MVPLWERLPSDNVYTLLRTDRIRREYVPVLRGEESAFSILSEAPSVVRKGCIRDKTSALVKIRHIRYEAEVAVMSYPAEQDIESGACNYADLRVYSEWNIERKVKRRLDGTDEALFPAGRVPHRSRKPADSAILYPGIRNRHCQLVFPDKPCGH